MRVRGSRQCALAAAFALTVWRPSCGDVVTVQLGAGSSSPPSSRGIEIERLDDGAAIVRLDLRPCAGKKIFDARLRCERDPIDGADPKALASLEIFPLRESRQGGGAPKVDEKPLELAGPWYRAFDVTELVRKWVSGQRDNHGLYVAPCPAWRAEKTVLEVAYEGKAGEVPPQPTGVRAFHRAGQTFITWMEIERRLAEERTTWGTLQKALAELDAPPVVRYRIYRHTVPITAETIAHAELLAEVRPLSCYNVEGRSLEALIYLHRRRSAEDIEFARALSEKWYFDGYRLDMPEMSEVIVDRFVIDESGRPLPVGSGLYVHNPGAAGDAYYAVATCREDVTNTIAFGEANATTKPVRETAGAGEPVFQAAGTLKVFWDYPGERRYYVQWCAPPLANLPNQYFNWSLFVPANRPAPAPVRVYLGRDQYMRPATPHRRDTLLVSGRDGPVWSFWYGYHESIGTLKSFRQGVVQPYTQRRLFAFIDWVMREFNGDRTRLSAVGGTEALYYGVKFPDRFTYVLADEPDPNVKATPAFVRIESYERRPPRREREAVWGLCEWSIPNDEGSTAWDAFDLISSVKRDPRREVAFLSMGPASLSAAWPAQVELMKALWQAKQPFCARFYWGGGEYLPLPETETVYRRADAVFDFALDIPMLALRNNSGDRGIDEEPFTRGVARYWGGGRIGDGRRWLPDVVDEPDRFEVTIHGRGPVAYAGGGASDVTPRRCKSFRPKPGDAFRWENVDLKTGRAVQSGEATADEHGLVTIPQVRFGDENSRLKILRAR